MKIFALLSLAGIAAAQTVVGKGMATFGTAIKGGSYKHGTEQTLYEYTVPAHLLQLNDGTTPPAVVTQQWFTGSPFDENCIVRVYIDGEAEASLQYNPLMASGVGFTAAMENNNTPWGNALTGHAANTGGIYNTYRIPFSKSIRITMYRASGDGVFWYIVRGVTNYPLVVGDLQLPANTRLALHKNENVMLTPLQYLPLVNATGTAGMVLQVTIQANSTDFNYLEACVRAYVDGDTTPIFLSSGTEDYFLSAFYFNRGIFHTPESGLTQFQGPGAMSAYRFHVRDPILFTSSLQLNWRCGEDGSCPNTFKPGVPAAVHAEEPPLRGPELANTLVSTAAWVYQYSF